MIDIEIDDINGVPSTVIDLGLYLGIEEHHIWSELHISHTFVSSGCIDKFGSNIFVRTFFFKKYLKFSQNF